MKLHHSATSPFVRKVLVCAAELGQHIEHLPSHTHPVNRDKTIVASNPLGQVPTFFTDDGTVLYDSRVICEYLDAQASGGQAGGGLFPPPGPDRWQALVEQALGDGVMAAAVLSRYERAVRPAEKQWDGWVAGQMEKVTTGLARMAQWAEMFSDRVDIGTITIGCVLGYMDFRFAELRWRESHPALARWYEGFSQRPSMLATQPQG